MKAKLGYLKVVDLRSIWGHEAIDFTKWLVRDENIAILAEEIEITIENAIAEVSAGRYSVDIVAIEPNSNRKIIIENQLEATDHKHLGQIITYASAHEASIIIWVVKDYTEEHKQAIEWFNRHMPEQISFFLVQIELWQIGDSEPAPKFNIISQPNNWAKTIKLASIQGKGSPSILKLQQQQFWESLKDYFNKLEKKSNINLGRTPRPQHWYDISIGTSKANIALTFNSRQNQISCELYIQNDQSIYDKIVKDEKQIKDKLGNDLIFMDLPEREAFRIIKYYQCDPTNENNWPEYHKWQIEEIEKFSKTFKEYFK